MTLQILKPALTVCKVHDLRDVNPDSELFFFAKTDEELSLVCPTADVPAETETREDGWRAFRITGVLDFSLTGILSALSGILAAEQIGIFAVSTYNTDYILVKEENLSRAAEAFRRAGHEIVNTEITE